MSRNRLMAALSRFVSGGDRRRTTSRSARSLRSRPMVTELERRDNPSAPAVLFDVPSMMVAFGGPDYSESHQLVKSFSETVTADQSGTGTEGRFTVDISGESHA